MSSFLKARKDTLAPIKKTHYGMILLALSAGLFSLQSIFSQFCYRAGFTVLSLLTGRYILAIIFLGIWCVIRKIPPFLPVGQRRIGVLIGLFSAVTIALLFTAFAHLPASVAIFCYYAYPALTVLWCRIFWRRPLERGQLISLVLSITGITLLSLDGFFGGLSVQGIVCAFGSAITMSVQIMLMERYMQSVHKVRYNFTVFCVALVIFGPVMLLFEGLEAVGSIQPEGFAYLGLLVLFATIGCNLLLTLGMESVPAPTAAILNTLEIPCTTLLTFVFLGDVLTWPQVAGGIMILLAVTLPVCLKKMGGIQEKRQNAKNL